ncbi:MAG: alpha-galactosidase [Victivallales bacterium]|nr:alpha-galactosidase [Victivallales bacterium]
MSISFQHQNGLFAQFDGKTLRFGNRFFERVVDLSDGFPRTVGVRAGDTEWADAGNLCCDCSFQGLNVPESGLSEYHVTVEPQAVYRESQTLDSPHLEITFAFKDEIQQAEFTRIFRVYADLPACSVQNRLTSQVQVSGCWSYRHAMDAKNVPAIGDLPREGRVDSFQLAAGVVPVRSVEFQGRTDFHNNYVIKHPLSALEGVCCGNLLYLEHDGATLLCLQEAPASTERRDYEAYDFRLDDQQLRTCCWGVLPEELRPGQEVQSYRNILLFAAPGQSPEKVLRRYLAARFPMAPSEAHIVVNPWGCFIFRKLVSEEFLKAEIHAADEIGAEVYQIDDGWQAGGGIGLGELTRRNRPGSLEFWKTSPTLLPNGFAPLVAAAKNVRLGLWCAPTMTNAFRDWSEFADLLLEYHRQAHFATFKIDGVRMQTYESERNLEALLRKVRTATNGQVYFNLDTTNGQRAGYFRFLEYGNVFLENRYVAHGGLRGYHPEKVLRNLWTLAKYVRTQSLQIEVPAPEDIQDPNDICPGLLDYPYEYWCAVALFSSILLWTAPSRLSQQTRDTLAKMFALHKSIRPKLFSGDVWPILAQPDGKSLTGFASDAGLYLLFREKDCPDASLQLPSEHIQILAGNATAQGNTITLPPASFCLCQA